MNKRLAIGLIVLVLVGGAAAAYFVTKDDEDTASNQNSSQTDNQPGAGENAFAPVSTENLEFKATITTTGNGRTTEATFEHDDKGTTRYIASQGEQDIEIIYTSDAYYSCQGDNCVKYPISQSANSGFDPSAYTYDDNKLSSYGNPAYQGQRSCPAGTCDVWSVSAGGTTSTIYVDADTKRISQVEGTVNGATSKIVYDYTDVTIEIPENAQEINLPS